MVTIPTPMTIESCISKILAEPQIQLSNTVANPLPLEWKPKEKSNQEIEQMQNTLVLKKQTFLCFGCASISSYNILTFSFDIVFVMIIIHLLDDCIKICQYTVRFTVIISVIGSFLKGVT